VKSSTEFVKMANAEGYMLELKDYDWATYDAASITQEERNRMDDSTDKYVRTKTKEELFQAALEKEMLLIPCSDAKDVVESPQLAAREFWVEVAHPELDDEIAYPGWPVKWTELPPYSPQRRAPLIGEHNQEVYEEMGLSSEQLVLMKTRGII
jgi:crotonobetainyl-CoA:carnitine CoA-transferase CaiB-like acyl-CoA transferase